MPFLTVGNSPNRKSHSKDGVVKLLGSWAGRIPRTRIDLPHLRRAGTRAVGAILRGLVLFAFVYVFASPVIFMTTTSVKTVTELNNPSVKWVSRNPTSYGYDIALQVMGYWRGLRSSVVISALAAVGQTLSGAIIAYGFARLRFPGRELLFGLLLFTMVIPPQTVMVPQFMLFTRLKLTNTLVPLILPAWFGSGVPGGVLLLVYRQFFRGLPFELEDAAYVDGAGPFRAFWQIMLPLAKPAILVVLLFSLVWTWNDGITPWLVIKSEKLMTITQRLQIFWNLRVFGTDYRQEENVFMAAVTMAVAPLLVLYVFTQRYFTQSIDRTGLVE